MVKKGNKNHIKVVFGDSLDEGARACPPSTHALHPVAAHVAAHCQPAACSHPPSSLGRPTKVTLDGTARRRAYRQAPSSSALRSPSSSSTASCAMAPHATAPRSARSTCAGLSSAVPCEAAGRQAETRSRARESAGRRGHVPVRKPLYRVLCREQCRREPCPCAVSVSLWCLARVPHVSLYVLEVSASVVTHGAS